MPSNVGDIARVARKDGAQVDDIEILGGRHSGERSEQMAKILFLPVRLRILGCRQHRIGVYIDRRHTLGACPNCCEGKVSLSRLTSATRFLKIEAVDDGFWQSALPGTAW